jgi:hypothetical protein
MKIKLPTLIRSLFALLAVAADRAGSAHGTS